MKIMGATVVMTDENIREAPNIVFGDFKTAYTIPLFKGTASKDSGAEDYRIKVDKQTLKAIK